MDEQARILLIEDDALVGQLFCELLPAHGLQVEWAADAEQGWELFGQQSFDAVVTDKNLPGMSGIELARRVRQATDEVQVIVITAYADMESALKAMEIGVYDYLCKPFDSIDEVVRKIERAIDKRRMLLENRRLLAYLTQANAEIEEMNRTLEARVKERTEQLRLANNRLEELTLTDDVTGLFNQRFLYQRLAEEFRRFHRHQQGLAVMMLDLDFFKLVNDHNDHLFGSRVLKRVGAIIKGLVRNVDMCVRYGGDEFTVILPHTNLNESVQVAQRLRVALEDADVGDPDVPFKVTVSIGVASLGDCVADSPRSLLRAADQALYMAKQNGRNRVAVMNGAHPVAVVA